MVMLPQVPQSQLAPPLLLLSSQPPASTELVLAPAKPSLPLRLPPSLVLTRTPILPPVKLPPTPRARRSLLLSPPLPA